MTLTKKQLLSGLAAVLLPAIGWSATDYIRTRDIAKSAHGRSISLEKDIRELRKDTLEVLVMLNAQFTGDKAAIDRLQKQIDGLKEVQ